MKLIIIILAMAVISACSTSKYGCATWKDVQKHDLKPFRVMGISHDRKKNVFYVYAWRYRIHKTLAYRCLPDSITRGKIVML